MTLFAKVRAFLPWPVNLMLGLIIFTALAWVVIHSRQIMIEKESLDMEVAKAVVQVGIVSVAGTLLSIITAEADRRRADRQNREELLKATLDRITSSYNRSKRARRDMRALGLVRGKAPVLVNASRYDQCLARVNASQLELETIISDVETGKDSYPSAEILTPKLEKMQEYLGALIREYERVRSRAGDGADEFPLRRVPWLTDFVGPVKRSKFKSEYAHKHGKARQAIREDLLALTSGSWKKKPASRKQSTGERKADAGSRPA